MRKSKQETEHHPDHSDEINRLRKVSGQIAGIEKMIVARRYCPEIIQQIRAAASALRAVELSILKEHMRSCIKETATSGSPSALDRKLQELLELCKG
jgi:DNA-binding FrmR family transcriptional regulator